MQGMNRDLAVSRFSPSLVYDARNIRITANNGKNSLLSITNEKGTSEVTITPRGEGDTPILGTIIGTAVLKDTLVLFTTSSGTDRIYKIVFTNSYQTATCYKLFQGQLQFDATKPLETLPVYETEDIQKVYWVDGINQPRVINIADDASLITDGDVFNFNRKISGQHTLNIEKVNTGGEFPAGTVQYCFNYFNKFGQETNIVDQSPMYYLSPQEKGLPADASDTSSFIIKILGVDSNYDFVRVYCIIRTSENAIPNVRIVGDYAISGNEPLTIIDNGIIGSTIDASALLFIGGQDIVAGTIAAKDNTLFLGNLKHNVPSIGKIKVNNVEIKTAARSFQTESCVYGSLGLLTTNNGIISADASYVSGDSFYDYPIDNNKSSYDTKTFKTREGYRLGFIAQYNTGQWSEVIWLGDFDETLPPGRHIFAYMYGELKWGPAFKNPGFKSIIPADVVDALRAAGFIRVAPVVVYPKSSERKVPYQGLLCGTVFNVADRATNSPYVQADWSFRSGYNWERISHEIQCNPKLSGVTYPAAIKNNNTVRKSDFVSAFYTQYYRDPSILTFHSPDLENEDTNSEAFKDLKLRIVGISNWGFSPTKEARESKDARFSFMTQSTEGALAGLYAIQKYPSNTIDNTVYRDYPLSYGGYVDGIISLATPGMDVRLVKYLTYLWHRNGPLSGNRVFTNGNETSNVDYRLSMLGKKCISELRYARTTFFQTSNSVNPAYVNVDIMPPKIVSEESTVTPIKNSNGDQLLYYGNIDKVLMANRKDLTGYEDYLGGTPLTLDMGGGYPIEIVNYTSSYNSGNVGANGLPSYLDADWVGADSYPKYINEIPDVQFDNDAIYASDPVSIKYKSTKHLVFCLKGSAGDNIYQLGTKLSYYISAPASLPFYWNDGVNLSIHDALNGTLTENLDGYSRIISNSVLVAELYREFDSNSRFGGISDDAIQNNIWVRCGASERLVAGTATTLYFKEGDTYIGRYDCLKTYPYTNEDQNQIVSIYSTELESRVNLDERYDKMRGLTDNTFVRPTNFNLFNHPGYEQTNQYFTYKAIDYDRYKSLHYPNMLTWSLEKKAGADVDAWTSIPMTMTADARGDLGAINAITAFNDTLYLFQNKGIAQVLFNERVQIPTSDGQPIEISSGMKYQGLRYLSNQIGLMNKWSLCKTPYGMYFVDDEKNTLYKFNGQQFDDLSTKQGFRTWLANNNSYKVWNPSEYDNVRTFYDKVSGDLYFMTKTESLVYSEQLGVFTSFMDYAELPYLANVNDLLLTATENSSHQDTIHKLFGGEYNKFFGSYKDFWITFVSNSDPTVDKVYDNLAWRSMDYDALGALQPLVTFDTLRVWNDHQDTGNISLVDIPGKPSSLKKKFNVFRALVPRDSVLTYKNKGLNRIRNSWAYIKLMKDNTSAGATNKNHLLQFSDLDVDFFE